MKRILLTFVICALMAAPALATPTLNFGILGGGGWSYNDSTNTFTFSQPIQINAVQGGTSDGLFTMRLHLPTMVLGGSSGAWTLPGGAISITEIDGTPILDGTLGTGVLDPSAGTTADAYMTTTTDIAWTTYSQPGFSPVADALGAHGGGDFDLTFNGGPSSAVGGFAAMLDGTIGNGDGVYSDGLSGSITIPAPGAILLGSIGVCLVGWLRRRRTLL